MVRSVRIAAVVVGLAWTGLAVAQTSPPTERFITVREEGKSPQRCKLLKTWHEANGVPAFQVQAVDSGEIMTIVGSAPAPVGDGAAQPRAMTTRIFHWGSDNKSPEGAPKPPTAPMTAPPATETALNNSTSPQIITGPQAALTAQTSQTVAPTTTVKVAAPAPPLPSSSTIATPIAQNPIKQQTILPPAGAGTQSPPAIDPSTPSAAPRLVPSSTAMASNPSPCGCGAPTACDACSSCNACNSSCCVTCPSCCEKKPSLLSRLFNKNTTCCPGPCDTVVCDPQSSCAATPVPQATPAPAAKVVCEPAQPGDWRQSWGKVEPFKNDYNASSTVTSRVTPTPMRVEAPATPDPLKAPDFYRGLAMSARPQSSKMPDEAVLTTPNHAMQPTVPHGGVEMSAPTMPMETVTEVPVGPPGSAAPGEEAAPPTQGRGRAVSLPANEANAFWTPPTPPPADKLPHPKANAFERDPNSPPQGAQRILPPGMAQIPMPPPGPFASVAQVRPPMPPAVDSGVPEAMGNAFTLAASRRPIPADFGGTPQEENGFGVADMVPQGEGSPPRPYGSGMAAMPGYGMANMPNMMPPGAHVLMSVPPTPQMPGNSVARANQMTVPQLLGILQDSLYPSQRELAVEKLSELSWKQHPQVVARLVKAARDDPAATVRATCVHALAHMQASSTEVVALVQSLKEDRDVRVRHEAEDALNTLGVASAPRQDSGIQRTSHK